MEKTVSTNSLKVALVIALGFTAACTGPSTGTTDDMDDLTQEANGLLAKWNGPYGGVPSFETMDLADLKPALQAGMARHLDQIDAIASNAEPPTFENTIVAMERAGRDFDRVMTYWGIWSANRSTPEFREIQKEMAPELSEYRTKITQNAALFVRIQAVYESRDKASLRPDQQRLVWLVYDGFARNGATLDEDAKKRYAQINKRLAEIHTKFANNVLADEEGYVHYITRLSKIKSRLSTK